MSFCRNAVLHSQYPASDDLDGNPLATSAVWPLYGRVDVSSNPLSDVRTFR
jgi:hypothetical protein